MNTRGRPRGLCRVSVIFLALSVTGCPKKDDQEPEASEAIAKSDPQPEAAAEAAVEGDENPAAAEADATGEPEAEPAGVDETGETPGDETSEEASEEVEEPAAPDPKALLKTAVNPRTKDDEAKTLMAQAEESGATVREVAKAGVDRGLALHATPERAKTFFEWAGEKDPKYPDPIWHLARQAAVQGDVDEAKELLGTVKQRGGKKLLQQIDFDPMWEILKDDPDVRKLL
jgi:Flp pilus assembly protein TadD